MYVENFPIHIEIPVKNNLFSDVNVLVKIKLKK